MERERPPSKRRDGNGNGACLSEWSVGNALCTPVVQITREEMRMELLMSLQEDEKNCLDRKQWLSHGLLVDLAEP